MPEYLKEALEAAGIEDNAKGKASFEIHLEMPDYQEEQLEMIISRESRGAAIRDGQRLERLLKDREVLPGKAKVHILSYPSEDKIVPAMLWVDMSLQGIGEVSVSAAADTLSQAMKAMQRVMPGAYMDS